MSEKRRLSAMFSVRLSPSELEQVQARASEEQESISGYLRKLALRDINARFDRCLAAIWIADVLVACDRGPGHTNSHHALLHEGSGWSDTDVEWKTHPRLASDVT